MEDILIEISNTLNKFDWVSFLMSLITIIISIAAIIFAIITDKKVAKNNAKIALLQTRINFYNDCINTYDFLKGSYSVLLSYNNENVATFIKKLEDQESKLMKCANTCQFLFNGDNIIYNTIKDLYFKFSKYVDLVSKTIINERDNNGFLNYLKSKNINPNELSKPITLEILHLSHEYNQSISADILELAKEIEDLLSSQEFDDMFKGYINTKI